MSVWPDNPTPAAAMLHTLSWEACGAIFQSTAGVVASGAWPAANRALFVPFTLAVPITVQAMGLVNGGTAAGNWDLGVYDTQGNRLCSTGPTAQAGTNVVQGASVTATQLAPGLYYLAGLSDSGSTTVFRFLASSTATPHYALGLRQVAIGSGTLPSSVTYDTTISSAYVPMIALTTRSSF